MSEIEISAQEVVVEINVDEQPIEIVTNELFFTMDGASVKSINGKAGDVVLTATDVGATTESYVDTEITTLQTSLQTSINTKADAASVTQSLSTKADLVGGVIPASQLPSFVDDVLEGTYVDPVTFNDLSGNPYIPEGGKIYVDVNLNTNYRWSGMLYVTTGGGGVSLGETAATAYRGDRGKIAYDHSQSQGNPHNTTTSEITEGNNKYFTDLRVRNTVLSGLVKTDSSNVTNTDTVEIAVGKLAAKSEAGGSVITWVDANTLTGYSKNNLLTAASTKVQFAKINGFIWMRGYITISNSTSTGVVLFSFKDTRFLWDNTFLGAYPDNHYLYDQKIHQNIKAQDTFLECKFTAKQIGTGSSGNITHTFQLTVGANITGDINFAVIEPVCIGIAKNP